MRSNITQASVLNTTEVRQDYADNAGEMKISGGRKFS